MSLEAQNRELQMFFEPQKTKEQSKEHKKRKSDILSQILFLDPLYF
jgi:hypothetical protein